MATKEERPRKFKSLEQLKHEYLPHIIKRERLEKLGDDPAELAALLTKKTLEKSEA